MIKISLIYNMLQVIVPVRAVLESFNLDRNLISEGISLHRTDPM